LPFLMNLPIEILAQVVIMDNAPIHTSNDFIANLDEWEGKGVFIKALPTYCPELNSIEILWRFIKYLWLPFSAFISYNALVKEVENILTQIGDEYTIDLAY
jgi:transposase